MFKNRVEAGQKLGEALLQREISSPLILALPRGGVPVANETAKALKTSLDVVIARKIGAPHHSEYGIGALSEDEAVLFGQDVLSSIDINGEDVKAVIDAEKEELRRRVSHYRGERKLQKLQGKSLILVDDGLATGVTAAAAGKFLRKFNPSKIILAVPVGPKDINPLVQELFDEIICLYQPENLRAVGLWFDDFEQVEDDEVIRILQQYWEEK